MSTSSTNLLADFVPTGNDVIIPEVKSLSIDDLSYQFVNLKEILKNLTKRIFQYLYHRFEMFFCDSSFQISSYCSVQPKHRHIVTILSLLNLQSEFQLESEPFTFEELLILIHEKIDEEDDYGGEDDCPQWLSEERWKIIKRLSSFPGRLTNLASKILESPDPWKQWMSAERPEV